MNCHFSIMTRLQPLNGKCGNRQLIAALPSAIAFGNVYIFSATGFKLLYQKDITYHFQNKSRSQKLVKSNSEKRRY